jgi:hypothetical protein
LASSRASSSIAMLLTVNSPTTIAAGWRAFARCGPMGGRGRRPAPVARRVRACRLAARRDPPPLARPPIGA